MAKSRDKVQQIGFWDTEVDKPDHDAVCLWAYANAVQIARAACPELFGRAWMKRDVHWSSPDDERRAADAAATFIAATPRPDPKVVSKVLECVLSSDTGYRNQLNRIVGYADLVIRIAIPRITPKYPSGLGARSDDPPDGFEVTENGDSPVQILVEAKSVLPTLGELMRQIRPYQTAFHGPVVVVAPDDKYAEILAEQRVTFVVCPSRL